VQDLGPFIQRQDTHWREPIAVEEKIVVALYKFMHGVSIPLVANKATIGKSTVHQILDYLVRIQNADHIARHPDRA